MKLMKLKKGPVIPSHVEHMASYVDGWWDGVEDGLKEGARRERRELLRALLKDAGWKFTHDPPFHNWIKSWLAARSKPAKREGGK